MIYVVGHRGAAGIIPENTIRGFRYAIDLGVDGVECDVHLTRDNHLVVMHDQEVDRTTDGSGRIRDLEFADVRALDAGEGEGVPTLGEVLDTVRGKVRLLCELKGEGVEAAAVDAVAARAMEDGVVFTSFHLERIAEVRRHGDRYRVAPIFADPSDDDIARAVELGASGVGVHYTNVCLRTVDRALEAGLDIRAWNPDTLREQKAMIALGVSGVGTNRPDILMDYLKGEDAGSEQSADRA
jgi:glycerophosphoryl diester phosphodiesterase